MADPHANASAEAPPLQPGLLPNLRFDLLSGFLVFLIAMPLCLGIASASQFPPIAGIWTAVIGGIITTFLSNSQLTIKGPAAGLIVVVAGSVVALGEHAVPALSEESAALVRADVQKAGGDAKAVEAALDKQLQKERIVAGYPLALGAVFVAGILQILLGLFRAGVLGELVPLTPVHGMLAAIGITIMVKQLFPMLGVTSPPAQWTPMEVIASLPDRLTATNWTIAAVGFAALAILIAFPYIKARVKFLKSVPAQLIVLVVAIPLGMALALADVGKQAGVTALVSVPNILANPSVELSKAFCFPDFSALLSGAGLTAILMFCVIASIESLLSSQAIDMIDPWKRKTDQNRDLLATGVANTLCAGVGALPMISEIVRSKANIDNGARTKYANFFHGAFLLGFVLLLPVVINMIPMAALGAMLVFVGFRLASPRIFIDTAKIGIDQLIVFVTTVVVTLSTDLLIGVLSGVVLEVVIHLLQGVPAGAFLKASVELVYDDGKKVVLLVRRAAVFSNWIGLKTAALKVGEGKEVVLDFTDTRYVDHSTMEKLHELEMALEAKGGKLVVAGLDNHAPMADHKHAARKQRTGPRSSDESAVPPTTVA